MARPKGSPQITHSFVTAFGKGPTIACKLRLTARNLGASYIGHKFNTLHSLPMLSELPVGYHLENFLSLIRFVRSQYQDLLTGEEMRYADDFEKLSRQAQSLFVRMALRKGPVFRSDKLHYADVEDIEGSAEELQLAGFVDNRATEDELLGLHSKVELLNWVRTFTEPKSLKRDALLEFVRREIDVVSKALSFKVYRPRKIEMLRLYRLLFFGNLSQDFSEFVLTDMGMLRYEEYTINTSSRLFIDRNSLELTLQLHELRDSVLEHIAVEKLQSDVTVLQAAAQQVVELKALVNKYKIIQNENTLSYRCDRLLNEIARQLERQNCYGAALDFYSQTSLAPGRERRTRILKKQGEEAAALDLCGEIIADSKDREELEFAQRFGRQLALKLHGTSDIIQTELVYETVNLELHWDSQGDSTAIAEPDRTILPPSGVEEAVRRWFEARDVVNSNQCIYVENGLIPSLFGLCFWDIIFAPVANAFVNPYQRGPLDLFRGSFLSSRQETIDHRLGELEKPGAIAKRCYATYEEKTGIANYFVNWALLSPALLEVSLKCIPQKHFLLMFSQLLLDLRNYRSGFPDLIHFFENELSNSQENSQDNSQNQGHRYEMIEVKGPGDQLQASQKRWITVFEQHSIPFKLVKVKRRQATTVVKSQ